MNVDAMLQEVTSMQLVEWDAYFELAAYEREHGPLPPYDPGTAA